MTKKDYEIKIAAAKGNKALNDKQREQIVAMYEKKIAELEPAKKAEPKAAVKKETAKKPESKKDSKSHIEEDLAAIHEYFNSNNVSSGDLGMRLKHRYDITDISDKGLRELEKQLKAKKSSKKIDYDCDELIAKAKKAKAAAKERAAAPKKTEVTKSKETIEKVHDKVQKNVEAGKFGKAQLQKLITETEDLLTFLKKTLKSL